MELRDFILSHEHDDLATLVLQRGRWPDIDVALAAECIAARRKLRSKVPEWYEDTELIFPSSLSAEQCSSTATAMYKASVARRVLACAGRIADLTGGLGVDSWQFASMADAVLYNEMNPALLQAAKQNFEHLGCGNVQFSCKEVTPDNISEILDSFEPDLVFADPARRDNIGRKVFLPEDCSPDILKLQDKILGKGCSLMVKLSPMADISLILRKFHCVKEVHVVEADGECKELLLVQVPDGHGSGSEPRITITVLDKLISKPVRYGSLHFLRSEENSAIPTFISEVPVPGQMLFEPGPALSKSGAFNLLSSRYGMRKLGPSTHLYCMDGSGSDVAGSTNLETDRLAAFGKWYEIQEVVPFSKAALRDFASHWPDASVTARSLPLNSDELSKRLSGLAKRKPNGDGGSAHIFGVGTNAGRLLIAASRKTVSL